MSYALYFHPKARQEFDRLDPEIRRRFRQKHAERLQNPRVPGSQLRGSVDRYKIKLRNPGFRLVYDLQHNGPDDQRLVVLVIRKRGDDPYEEAGKRSG